MAAAASLSLVLAACGGDTDSSASPKTEGKVTLEFWSWTDGIEAQTKVWNKAHPETQIKFVNAAVAAWNAVSPGGTTFGIPMGSSPLFTAYRADLFEKYGIEAPKTWDDLIAAGKKVQEQDKDVKTRQDHRHDHVHLAVAHLRHQLPQVQGEVAARRLTGLRHHRAADVQQLRHHGRAQGV
ncbi:ABC transporter substrate-binding protein [Streptomyces sp. NPDC002643]